jgi:hypothetical protein
MRVPVRIYIDQQLRIGRILDDMTFANSNDVCWSAVVQVNVERSREDVR